MEYGLYVTLGVIFIGLAAVCVWQLMVLKNLETKLGVKPAVPIANDGEVYKLRTLVVSQREAIAKLTQDNERLRIDNDKLRDQLAPPELDQRIAPLEHAGTILAAEREAHAIGATMSRTITITDGTAGELMGLVTGASIALSRVALDDLQAQLAPPVVVPPTGDLAAQVKAAAAAKGFGPVIFRLWDFSQSLPKIETAADPDGPFGQNGIAVIAFTPTTGVSGGTVTFSEYSTGAGGSGLGTVRACAISANPCEFVAHPNGDPANWARWAYNTGIQFTIAPNVVRGLPMLTPGVRYFINAANRDEFGFPTGGLTPEARIQASRG